MPLSIDFRPPHEKIASKFGLTYNELAKLIYPDTNKNYISFEIPKKNGKPRKISAPKPKLLSIQRTLADELEKYYSPKKCCHGFTKERSIVSNAQNHVHRKYVFNIDLENFFESIHFGRVKNLLKSKPFNYSEEEAIIIAQICCHNGSIPQGAPTSPIISNLICWKLDAQLQKLAHENNCTYSRYADDITFSFTNNRKNLPKDIVLTNNTGEVSVGFELIKIIDDNGFKINKDKVRLQGRNQRQEVTGITVNQGTNLKREFIRQTGSMLHAWKKFGSRAAEKDYLEKYRLKEIKGWQKDSIKNSNGKFFECVVKGRINYIQMVLGRSNEVYRKLAYRLTEVMGIPNIDFKKSHEELATFVIDNLIESAQGTGFILDQIGLITNHHVAEGIDSTNDSCLEIYRYFERDRKRKAHFTYSNRAKDIAIFKPNIQDFEKIPTFKIGDDSKLKRGDIVKVVGFPGHAPGGELFMSTGNIVSKRVIFDLPVWIIDKPINHGCSGGPILNEREEVIGIATFGKAQNDGSTELNGFIPISTLTSITSTKQYESLAKYPEMLAQNPAIGDNKEVFIHQGKTFCKDCYKSKRISHVTATKEENTFNCKICAKTIKL